MQRPLPDDFRLLAKAYFCSNQMRVGARPAFITPSIPPQKSFEDLDRRQATTGTPNARATAGHIRELLIGSSRPVTQPEPSDAVRPEAETVRGKHDAVHRALLLALLALAALAATRALHPAPASAQHRATRTPRS